MVTVLRVSYIRVCPLSPIIASISGSRFEVTEAASDLELDWLLNDLDREELLLLEPRDLLEVDFENESFIDTAPTSDEKPEVEREVAPIDIDDLADFDEASEDISGIVMASISMVEADE